MFNDADIQMAHFSAEARALSALRRRGICTHGSVVGLPDSGEIFYPEQVGLVGAQVRCTSGCGALFESRDEWVEALLDLLG